MPSLRASVVIPTYNRPDRVRTCLEHLARQSVPPVEIVVVDSSPGDQTQAVVAAADGVIYRRNPMGRGATAESRAIGLADVTAEVVAFLDDDANARPDWLHQLLLRYADETVGGVGGSALNGIPGERDHGFANIGRLLPDGRLTGFFAADPGRDVVVDHLLGANMSFRRAAIDQVGGIHGGYPGTCLREESDLALRLRRTGYHLVYTPDAVVDHLPGEYAKGKRFDRRYSFYGNRNHVVLLARTLGWSSPITRRFPRTAVIEIRTEMRRLSTALPIYRANGAQAGLRTVVGVLTRMAALSLGLVAGYPAAFAQIRSDRRRSAPSARVEVGTPA
ncbi:MAG: glycosyltransferase family 2 protein [Propionibacteriaceae bacterium]